MTQLGFSFNGQRNLLRGYLESFRRKTSIEARRGTRVRVSEECAPTSEKSQFLACTSGFDTPNWPKLSG